jgi:hypothetical protein
VAIVILALLLGVLVWVFYGLIKPKGLPSTIAETEGMTWVRSIYGYGPASDEQLYAPGSVAIGPNGDIYATDATRARIMVFRSDGTFRRLIHTGAGGTGKGQFIRPESIDVDSEGVLWIADSQAGKVIAFDRAGAFVREFPIEIQARGIYVDNGRVHVLDLGRILVFDTAGKKLGAFGVRGPQPGQIDAYQGITAKDGAIYIADSFNKRLQAFDESGAVVWTVPGGAASRRGPTKGGQSGPDGSASEQVPDHRWDLPQDLVFDGRGQLVVVDAFNFEIAIVDPKSGKVMSVWGDFGRNDGQFFYPTSIDYDANRDWFAVADTQNNRIQIVRIPGTAANPVAGVWRALSSPYRYLLIPLLLVLVALVLTALAVARMIRNRRAAEEPLAEL